MQNTFNHEKQDYILNFPNYLQFNTHIRTRKNQIDVNGLKQGYWEKFYPNGIIQYSGTFKNNVPIGIFKRYNQDGDLVAEMSYLENSDKVYTKFYYPGEKLRAEGYYINKQKDSVWIYYSEEGFKINEVPYVNDKKHGTEKSFMKAELYLRFLFGIMVLMTV